MIWRASWRHHARSPWLLALAVIGVAVGVAMVAGIDLANSAARRAFADAIATVTGTATHQVLPGPNGINDADYARLRTSLPQGVQAAPVIEAEVMVADHPGRVLRLLGVDPFAEGAFRSGLLPIGGSDRSDFSLPRFLTEPGAVVLAQYTATELGLTPGSTFLVRVGGRRVALKLLSTFQPAAGFNARALRGLALTDISTAQEILGRVGALDRIDLLVPAGSEAALAVLLRPADSELQPSGARAQAIQNLTAAFHTNLSALSLIAVVVAMFLIYNTATFSVVSRRDLIGRLRAAGATRAAIAGVVLGEAALLGLVASLIGIGAGIALAHGLIGGMTRTIGELYATVPDAGIVIEPLALFCDLLVGVLATVVAAAVPAWEATTVPPRVALGRSHSESAFRARLPWLALCGVVLMAAAGAVMLTSVRSVAVGFAGLGGLIAGYALVVPIGVVAGMWLLRPIARALFGPIGAMGVRSVVSALSRTGVAVAALSIAAAASLGIGVMVASFRATVDEWLTQTLVADLYVTAPRPIAAKASPQALSPTLVTRLLATPGVAAAVPKRDVKVRSSWGEVSLSAFDHDDRAMGRFRVTSFVGSASAAAAWQGYVAGNGVLITEPLAWRQHLHAGQTLRLRTAQGEHDFPITGVVVDYANDQGQVFISGALYRQWWRDTAVTSLSLTATPDVGRVELERRLRAQAGGDDVVFTASRDLLDTSLAVFDRTFAITDVARILAGVVAFIGVLSALMALSLERTREIGVLRAHGCTPGQVVALVLTQCGATGLIAGLLSLPLGLAMAQVLAAVINRRSFGWTFPLALPPGLLAQAVGLAVIAALLAGVYPAWRMARTSPAAVLRDE